MTYELVEATNRLDNIRRVKPILTALRTISLGSWQMARNRRAGLGPYTARLLRLLAIVVPHVSHRQVGLRLGRAMAQGRRREGGKQDPAGGRVVVVVIGSERGLCGRYNKVLLERLEGYLAGTPAGTSAGTPAETTAGTAAGTSAGTPADMQVELVAMGSRMAREMILGGYDPAQTKALSVTALPSFDLAFGLVADWLQRYEAYELDAVDVLYNADQGVGTYGATVVRLIPPELPVASPWEAPTDQPGFARRPVPDAEIPVVTDPVRLYIRIVEQWTATAAYRLLLEGAVTEHSTRYQLMEAATQNADDLVSELDVGSPVCTAPGNHA